MDIATNITTLTPPATATATVTTTNSKSPEADIIETPTRIQSSKPLSFTNGVLKRHHHAKSTTTTTTTTITKCNMVVEYKECLKNHAASLGGHALDGCGEFMPSPTATPTVPTSLKCAACGCHRNFHRRDVDDPQPPLTPTATQVIEYQPYNRHHPPPPPRGNSPSPPSPPPISSSYYPSSAPHMLLALSAGLQGPPHPAPVPENLQLLATPMGNNSGMITPNGRKRFRTKFSQGQKERMLEFAERVGWKMQKRDEEMVVDFCNEIGVDRGVLKVWMHNNKSKSAVAAAEQHHVNGGMNTNTDTHINNINNNNTNHNLLHRNHNDDNDDDDDDDDDDEDRSPHLATNGSSSSS